MSHKVFRAQRKTFYEDYDLDDDDFVISPRKRYDHYRENFQHSANRPQREQLLYYQNNKTPEINGGIMFKYSPRKSRDVREWNLPVIPSSMFSKRFHDSAELQNGVVTTGDAMIPAAPRKRNESVQTDQCDFTEHPIKKSNAMHELTPVSMVTQQKKKSKEKVYVADEEMIAPIIFVDPECYNNEIDKWEQQEPNNIVQRQFATLKDWMEDVVNIKGLQEQQSKLKKKKKKNPWNTLRNIVVQMRRKSIDADTKLSNNGKIEEKILKTKKRYSKIKSA
ncbi:uncharacterized protein LOC130644771 [Hydractinia symbiolongicarpus]|uniref:uncharacterized protein LOC130644771 n=1 Tax=Hydractinia symbiolongicarpus TaxID=13093 RepID=UPI0025500D50|nr:uncharacterized protein LOC130644771 [Hydractinia symbiolongicarpus]